MRCSMLEYPLNYFVKKLINWKSLLWFFCVFSSLLDEWNGYCIYRWNKIWDMCEEFALVCEGMKKSWLWKMEMAIVTMVSWRRVTREGCWLTNIYCCVFLLLTLWFIFTTAVNSCFYSCDFPTQLSL